MMWYFMKNFEQLVVQKILESYQIKTSGKNWILGFHNYKNVYMKTKNMKSVT